MYRWTEAIALPDLLMWSLTIFCVLLLSFIEQEGCEWMDVSSGTGSPG